MKKCILILSIISIIGCTHHGSQKRLNKKENEELRIDTKILKSLNDSLNSTGDYQYYKKYMVKIDEMIKKYPEQKDLLKVRESMKEIFGDSLSSSKTVK
jgi:hypothetical protein